MTSIARLCSVLLSISSVVALVSATSAGAVGFEPIPLSVAADGAGHVYLSNPLSSSQVQQYSSDGRLLANLGDFAVSGNPFTPRGIATDAAGNLYVDDGEPGIVWVLLPSGDVLRQWKAFGGRDLAAGADGSVYLAESHEIRRFSGDGTLLSKWGGSALAGGEFGDVWGIDLSPSGLVYVADTYGNQIQVFTADGTPVTKWGKYGRGPGQFVYPYGIAVGPSGDVYVADTANARVEKFNAEGAFLSSWGGPGKSPGRFYTPTSVTTDPAGYVYVADSAEPYPNEGRARVQKFTPDGQFVTQWYDGPPPFTSPPPPRIESAVSKRTRKRTASFEFTSRVETASFECRLSGERVPRKLRGWRTCTSPQRYTHLRPGRKAFHVRARRGIWLGAEAKRSWLIRG
jgi:hypothetical protein